MIDEKKVIEEWTKLGFLEGSSNPRNAALAMEITANKLMGHENEYPSGLTVGVFPTLVRIFKNTTLPYTQEYIAEQCDIIIKDLTKIYSENPLLDIFVDIEAAYLNAYAENYKLWG